MVDKCVWTRFTYNLSHSGPSPAYVFKAKLKKKKKQVSGDSEMSTQLGPKSITILNIWPSSHQSYSRISEGNDRYGVFHTFFCPRKTIDSFLEMQVFTFILNADDEEKSKERLILKEIHHPIKMD